MDGVIYHLWVVGGRPQVSKSLVVGVGVDVGLVLSCAMCSRYFVSSEADSAGLKHY